MNGTDRAPNGSDGSILPRFGAPYDWDAVDDAVMTVGAAIVKDLLDTDSRGLLNGDIDAYLGTHPDHGVAASGSDLYDSFLGHRTIRMHGLLAKVPSTVPLIGDTELMRWAERLLQDVAESVLLNAGELIEICPGEPAQLPHRDSDSWPELAIGSSPVVVNAIVALDDCNLENGATYVAPHSWKWNRDRQVADDEWVRAVMTAGDALLFRGDVVHRGGENLSAVRRRVLSISYCAGWLRPVENSFLNVPRDVAAELPEPVQDILGYRAHDATMRAGGFVGLYENGDPRKALVKTGTGITE